MFKHISEGRITLQKNNNIDKSDICAYFLKNTPSEVENVMIQVANSFISKGITTMKQICDVNLNDLAEALDTSNETIELLLLLCDKYITEHSDNMEGCDSS